MTGSAASYIFSFRHDDKVKDESKIPVVPEKQKWAKMMECEYMN